MIRERRITAGGYTVSVACAGSGPTVVLVPGLGLGADVWRHHVAFLAARGYSVLAPDMPGFGRSGGPMFGFRVETAADWLEEFARAADVEQAVWVGHSVSAQYVLYLHTQHPDLVRGLVLAAPTGEPGAFRWFGQLVGLARTSAREPAALIRTVLRHYATTPPQRTAGSWLGARRHPILRDAASVTCPMRVVLGGRDPVVPRPFGEQLAQNAPLGELVVIPDSAHGVALDPPEPFCATLLDFLERHTNSIWSLTPPPPVSTPSP